MLFDLCHDLRSHHRRPIVANVRAERVKPDWSRSVGPRSRSPAQADRPTGLEWPAGLSGRTQRPKPPSGRGTCETSAGSSMATLESCDEVAGVVELGGNAESTAKGFDVRTQDRYGDGIELAAL